MTIEQALDRLLEVGGSDLLISCGSPPRLRRDGRLEVLDGLLLTPAAVEPMVLAPFRMRPPLLMVSVTGPPEPAVTVEASTRRA